MYGAIAGSIGSGVKAYGGVVAERKAAAAAQKENALAEAAALEEEQNAYNLESGKIAPWETFADKSRMSLEDLLGYNGPEKQAAALEAMKSSPSFQLGVNAIDRSAATRGGLNSGRTYMALQDYGMNRYDDEIGRRTKLAQAGYGITSDSIGYGGNYYRRRGKIRSDTRLRAGEIQSGKWKGYGRVQADANDSAMSSWGGDSGSGYGGGKGGGGNPYSNDADINYRDDGSYSVDGQGYYDWSY